MVILYINIMKTTGAGIKVSIPTPLSDSFYEYGTKNILYGKYVEPPNDYIKKVMVAVIKSYTKDAEGKDVNEWGQFYNDLYEANKQYTYDDITSLLKSSENKTPTAEYILASAMYGYKDIDATLITRCLNTFCRPVKLDAKEEWLDNWTLNGPGNALNFVFWKEYDSNDVMTVSRSHEGRPMNQEPTDFSWYNVGKSITRNGHDLVTQQNIKEAYGINEVIMKIVGVFRTFLICNELLPGSINKTVNNNETIISPKDVINSCVSFFPFYYLGCGGCDMFDGNYTAKIETVKQFADAFPMVTFGSIVNVSTFRGGSGGSHWMGLYITDNVVSLMCSQGSTWDVFDDEIMGNDRLKNRFLNCNFSLQHNLITCQKDRCNCGVYSLLFLFMMLVKNGNMTAAVEQVGVDANNLYNKPTEIPNNKLIYKVKATLFGYE